MMMTILNNSLPALSHDASVAAHHLMIEALQELAVPITTIAPRSADDGAKEILSSFRSPYTAHEESDSEDDDDPESWEYPISELRDFEIGRRDGTDKMVWLTGSYPFDSEPPLSCLMQHGFLTPTSLHYVCNQGYVPQVGAYDEWSVEVTGLVRRPQRFSMKQLVEEFAPCELPVTLACAGNRGKEQNMVKQTIGLSWGAAAVSTSVWRGARLCDVLHRCGVMRKKLKQSQQLYVCFEGAGKRPGSGVSEYATSIPLEIGLDKSQDILVAYLQNGRPLEADHGFPVRIILPGFICSRMIKWLTHIHVTDCESNSYYHVKENRVFPPHIDAIKADTEDWWHKPDHLVNELNINSVITSPAHGEVVPITLLKPYNLRGYAYSGGGRMVTRVEISMNQGQSWRHARVIYTEKPTKYGKYWCWCFWELPIYVMDLLQARELVVRAWDSAMNTQPETLTWNVLGLMNNCWFRVKVNLVSTSSIGFAFDHPTIPGNQSGGWMQALLNLDGDDTTGKPGSGVVNAATAKVRLGRSVSMPALSDHANVYTTSDTELKQHSPPESSQIMARTNVYDCTKSFSNYAVGKGYYLVDKRNYYMNPCTMLAMGFGVTPTYQHICNLLENPSDHTQIFLIFIIRKEEDILLRNRLVKLANRYPCKFNVWYDSTSPADTLPRSLAVREQSRQ